MACFNVWDIGGCGCSAGTCTQVFTVQGCFALPYQGVTVSVYTSLGGTLLASGATNVSGQVTLSWTGVTGAYYVTVTGGAIGTRFAAYGQSLTLTCGGAQTIALALAANYFCISNCVLPVKNVVNWTNSILGGATLTFSTRTFTLYPSSPTTLSGWWGTIVYGYPGAPTCGGCSAQAGYSIDILWNGSNVTLFGQVLVDVVSGSLTQCPFNPGGIATTGYTNMTHTSGTPTLVCPPSLNFSGTSAEQPPGSPICIYGDATTTATDTVTE